MSERAISPLWFGGPADLDALWSMDSHGGAGLDFGDSDDDFTAPSPQALDQASLRFGGDSLAPFDLDSRGSPKARGNMSLPAAEPGAPVAGGVMQVFLPAPQTKHPSLPSCPFACQTMCEYRVWSSRELFDGKAKSFLFGHYCASCNIVIEVSSKKPDEYRPFRVNDDGTVRNAVELADFMHERGHFPHSYFDPRGQKACAHCLKRAGCRGKKRARTDV